MIPKVIHYCWFGGKPLPKDVLKCIKSWKRYCPNYKIVQWNEDNFDVYQNQFVKKAYEKKLWAFVSDYARLKIVYDNGGIYLDTDVELIKNIDFLLDNNSFFGVEQRLNCIATGLGFGSIAKSEVLKDMMEIYDNVDINIGNLNDIACPKLNTKVLQKYGYEAGNSDIQTINSVTIYPPRYFDPISTGDSNNLLCEDTVSIHHYSASWTSPKNQLKRKFTRIIGVDKVTKIKNIRNKILRLFKK